MAIGFRAKALTVGAAALATLLLAPAAFAQSAGNPTDVLAPADDQLFTFTFRSTALSDASAWRLTQTPALELNAGDKWGFTLGLDNLYDETFEFEDVRAGAFFDITPRMRLGGELSFSHENDPITRAGVFDEDVPEVKFESAFKF